MRGVFLRCEPSAARRVQQSVHHEHRIRESYHQPCARVRPRTHHNEAGLEKGSGSSHEHLPRTDHSPGLEPARKCERSEGVVG